MHTEQKFDISNPNQLILLPGLMAPARTLFPLTDYLRTNQEKYSATAVALRMSLESFDKIVERAYKTIRKNLLEKSSPKTIVLFAHSFGGRTACELARRLKKDFPEIEYGIITTGSPLGMASHHPSLINSFFSISKAYRDWPAVTQPDSSIAKKFIGFYSTEDKIVPPWFATRNYKGELIELHGLAHGDLDSPEGIGPRLLNLLEKEF